MKTTLEILTGMRELLADEERWTKGANARDAKGAQCEIVSRDAKCWCIWGALGRVAQASTPAISMAAHAAMVRAVGSDVTVSRWNDAPERTHAEVLAALDKAIELERSAQ